MNPEWARQSLIFTGIGVILTALAFLGYIRLRKSRAGKSSPSAGPAAAIQDRTGTTPTRAGDAEDRVQPAAAALPAIHRPAAETRRAAGVILLLGVILTVFSLYLYSGIAEEKLRVRALPFTVLGLLMAAVGFFYPESDGERAGGWGRIAGVMAGRLRMDPIQLVCLTAAAGFGWLAFAAGDLTATVTGLALSILGGILGIGLALAAAGRFILRWRISVRK
jgi:hypothetical protein